MIADNRGSWSLVTARFSAIQCNSEIFADGRFAVSGELLIISVKLLNVVFNKAGLHVELYMINSAHAECQAHI